MHLHLLLPKLGLQWIIDYLIYSLPYLITLICVDDSNLTQSNPITIRNGTNTRNKQQQKFSEFIKPLIDRIYQLQLKASDFEQLKVIGRGAFGQVALVKVIIVLSVMTHELWCLTLWSTSTFACARNKVSIKHNWTCYCYRLKRMATCMRWRHLISLRCWKELRWEEIKLWL